MITELPDLSKSMKFLKISVDLEGVTQKGAMGQAVNDGLRTGRLDQVISMLKDQIRVAPDEMLEFLGVNLFNEIKNI